MRKLYIFGTAAALCAVPLAAYAAGEMGMGPMATFKRADVEAKVKDMFAKLDTNKDGAVTREEATSARDKMRAEMHARNFERLDANKDGSISRAEFDDAHKAPPAPIPAPMGAGDHDHAMPAPGGADGMGAGHGMMGHHKMGHGGMGGMMGMRMFERADANKDGKVTLAEATAQALAHFDEVDTNKDGQLAPEERRAFHAKMGGLRGKHDMHRGH